MNITAKKIVAAVAILAFFVSALPVSAHAASPWAKEATYWGKTKGKLAFGLKNTFLGWMTPWAESRSPKYKKEWEGFSVGMWGLIVNTLGGFVQLATFYIPADFPDIGHGLPIPDPNWHPVMYQK